MMVDTALRRWLSRLSNNMTWVLALAITFFVGMILSILVVLLTSQETEIVCPPFMDRALYEIKGVYVWYAIDAGPDEYVELDQQFIEACGYTILNDPEPIQPLEPPPEEGGA